VPHHTPTTARAPIAASEFRLYRPFLPGGEREAGDPVGFVHAVAGAQEQSEHASSLRPIGDFLDASQKLGDYQPAGGDPYTNEADEEPDELPPVEHFLDPLPPVDKFAPAPDAGPSDAWRVAGEDPASRETRPRDPAEAGWGETDWQHYDWRSAAALGESGVDEATTEWAATDWDGTGHRPRERRQSAANAIATALDEIARRIREGDLSSSGPGPMTDPATIAATLAALLGVRR
jgi:hypothetical protein